MNDLKNYYEVLEIPTSARSEDIYHSYQRAKFAYSSESLAIYSLISGEECRNILNLIEEAYSILSDPAKRRRYDEARGLNTDFTNMSYNPLSQRDLRDAHSNREEFPRPAASNSFQSSPSSTPSASNVTKLVAQNQFALNYVTNADFEKEIEETNEFSGAFLRKIREYKNLDMQRLCDMTKVSRNHLQDIEDEDFSRLPAAVYVRGFVFQYAKCLKLKPELVANSYTARMKKIKP
jgi:curved DNA-binding protein CbpA